MIIGRVAKSSIVRDAFIIPKGVNDAPDHLRTRLRGRHRFSDVPLLFLANAKAYRVMAPLMPTIYKSTALRSFGTRAWFPRLECP